MESPSDVLFWRTVRRLLTRRMFSSKGDQLAFDNTQRVARIAMRAEFYLKYIRSAWGEVPLFDMARQHFPFWLPSGRRPAYIDVEFTNNCNLRCPYCTNARDGRKRGFMSESVFSRFLQQVRESGVARVKVVGNGEPTMHPRFISMIRELGQVAPYLSMITNGQLLDEATLRAIVEAPVRVVEISAHSNSRDGYERSGQNGTFEKVLQALERLRVLRQEGTTPILVNIRVMIRPSELAAEHALLKFWRELADSAVPQYVHDEGGYISDTDVFRHCTTDRVPRCVLPFNCIGVCWTGDIPLCEFSAKQTGTADGVIIGNILQDSLIELWNGTAMRGLRAAHRYRDLAKAPFCKGCVGL